MKKIQIKTKVFLVTAGVTLLSLLVFSIMVGIQLQAILIDKENEYNESLIIHIDNLLDDEISRSQLALKPIANNTKVKELFANRDRDGLLDYLLDGYLSISDEMYQFQFHLPDSESFVRFHKLGKYGDSLKGIRHTVDEANAEKKTVTGLEKGVFGYGIRVVIPMEYNGQHIGTVEYGAPFSETFLNKIKEDYEGEYYIYEFVEEGTEGNGLLAGTTEDDVCNLSEANKQDLINGMYVNFKSADKSSNITLYPFHDYNGVVTGYIKCVTDRAEFLQIQRSYMTNLAIFSAIILIIISFVIYFITKKSLNKVSGDLETGLKEASRDIMNQSVLIGQSNQEITDGVETQYTAINNITNSMSKIKDDIVTVVNHIHTTNESMVLAMDEIDSTNKHMDSVEGAINDIKDSSDKISKINKIIENIAFQTNMLSLNAAVEAARAGEAGQGFSVVSEEVRNLAGRSADASKETLAIIDESSQRVDDGIVTVESAAAKLHSLVDSINVIAKYMKEIEMISEKQKDSILALNNDIQELEKVVELNKNTVISTNSIGDKLNEESKSLEELIDSFVKSI